MDSKQRTPAEELQREKAMMELKRSAEMAHLLQQRETVLDQVAKITGLTPGQAAMPSPSTGEAYEGQSVSGTYLDEASDMPREMMAAVAATRRVYLKSSKPLEIGQVKIKSFQCAVIPPAGREDPTWLNRCADYWELQMALYGYRVAGMTIDFDVVEGMNIVTTSAQVIDVLPGDRTDSRVDWAADRLKNGPLQR